MPKNSIHAKPGRNSNVPYTVVAIVITWVLVKFSEPSCRVKHLPRDLSLSELVHLVPLPIAASTLRIATRHPVLPGSCDVNNFCLVHGYSSRVNNAHFVDISNRDEWQLEVYTYAYNLASLAGFSSVVDIGCGSGFKLVKFFGGSDTHFVGYEVEPSLSFLKSQYPTFEWRDIHEAVNKQSIRANGVDMLITSDVIEHVVDVEDFINFISSFRAKVYVISTPERDGCRGPASRGPPENMAHVREWNRLEFVTYMQKYFTVLDSLTSDTGQFGANNTGFGCSQWIVAQLRSV